MITIEITYNGKKYDDLGSAMDDAIVEGVVTSAREVLKPFEREITAQGGVIKFDIKKGKLSASIEPEIQMRIVGISDDLKGRIEEALGK